MASNSQPLLTMSMASAIAPQLIVAFGITLALLLVAWRRSQRTIAIFTFVILALALLANIGLMLASETQVTQLLKVDGYSTFAFSLVLISAIAVLRMSYSFLRAHIEVHDEYYLLLLLLVLGAGVLVVSDHFASLFLGFELLSISLVGLVGYHRQSNYSVESALKYLILSATASSFMLLGIAFIYSITGSLSFSADLTHDVFQQQSLGVFFQLGLLLFVSGIAFKLSIAPFHFWTPDVYQGAPTPITLLMATISKVAMFVVLLKCIVAQGYLLHESFQLYLLLFAIISMLLGNVMALKQQNLKRLLAYSSIAHMGYLLIVIIVTAEQSIEFSWQTTLYYLAAYTVANVSVFMVIALIQQNIASNVEEATGKEDVILNDLHGLFWRNPSYAVLLLLGILSLAGIPLTMGFIGKFYILSQATIAHAWWLIATLIVGSGIALAYYLPIVFALFGNVPATDTLQQKRKNHPLEKLLIFSFIVASLLFGIMPDLVTDLIKG